MGDHKKYVGDEGRVEVRAFDPDALILIEQDGHFLYDPRVKQDLDPDFVESVRCFGVRQNVTVWADGDRMVVVTGRQRVRAARIVKERGIDIKVPCRVIKGSELELYRWLCAENQQRIDDAPTVLAHKLARYIDMGGAIEQAAVDLRLGSVREAKNLLALLDCAAPVQEAADDGEIAIGNIAKLAGKSREEQIKLLGEMRDKGAMKGRKARAVIDGDKPPAARMRSRAVVERLCDAVNDKRMTDIYALLMWILGDDAAISAMPEKFAALVVEASAPQKRGPKPKSTKAADQVF